MIHPSLTWFTTLMARKSTSPLISSLSTSNSLLTWAICLATASPSCCRARLVTAAWHTGQAARPRRPAPTQSSIHFRQKLWRQGVEVEAMRKSMHTGQL